MSEERKMMRGVTVWALLLALAAALAACAGTALYARYGGLLLARGDRGVSRLYVGEAERMGNAGAPDEALALYEKAFSAGFGHPPDRSRALTLKGLLLWRQGRVKETAETLSAAASGSAPNFDGAQALIEALLHLRRVDEAQSVLRRWRGAAGESAPPQTRADMLYCAGRVAQERGDIADARAAYGESAALAPGKPAEYRLGALCAEAGETGEALRHLERFLLGGASGNEAARARELHRALQSNPTAPQ